MARYIITDTQLHSVVYQYMDKLIDREKDKKESPWSDEGYTMTLYDKDGRNRLFYAWYTNPFFAYLSKQWSLSQNPFHCPYQ